MIEQSIIVGLVIALIIVSNKFKGKLDRLRIQLTRSNASWDVINARLVDSMAREGELRKELGVLKTELEELREDGSRHETLKTSFKDQGSKVATLYKLLDDANDAIKELKEDIRQYEHLVRDQERRINNMNARVQTYEDAIKGLQNI